MAKMGCPEATGARGDGGAAREALWRRGEGERRPAVGEKRCDDTGEEGGRS